MFFSIIKKIAEDTRDKNLLKIKNGNKQNERTNDK